MKKKIVIVDTNVPITANGQAEHASLACRLACIKALQTIRAQRRIALDESGLILQEYRNNLSCAANPALATPSSSGCGTTKPISKSAPRFRLPTLEAIRNLLNFPLTRACTVLTDLTANLWQ